MEKNRLEAFTDGVMAIIITIMVLELKVPHSAEFAALAGIWPIFLSYVLSFLYVGIYWNAHHHLFQTSRHVSGAVLWANLHLLFWLSLMPFTTGWMGENHFARLPVAVFGLNLLLAAIAYLILQTTLVRLQGPHGVLAQAIGQDWKGKVSTAMYPLGIALALWVAPWVGFAVFWVPALMWIVPDRRMESIVSRPQDRDTQRRN